MYQGIKAIKALKAFCIQTTDQLKAEDNQLQSYNSNFSISILSHKEHESYFVFLCPISLVLQMSQSEFCNAKSIQQERRYIDIFTTGILAEE